MQNTVWFAAFVVMNGALLLLFTAYVSRLRMKHKVSYGDGSNHQLMKAIRVHANGVEQVPIYGLLILALCYLGASSVLLAVLIISFTLSRVLHAYGMFFGVIILRQFGAGITYLAQFSAIAAVTYLVS